MTDHKYFSIKQAVLTTEGLSLNDRNTYSINIFIIQDNKVGSGEKEAAALISC